MKKTVIHVDSYFPTEPTWIFDHLRINMVEQIRVVTVSHEKWGYECYIDYVYITAEGERCVWIGYGTLPSSTCESRVFRGNVITKDIFDMLYRTEDTGTHAWFYEHILNQCNKDWSQLTIASDVLEYCKEKKLLSCKKK